MYIKKCVPDGDFQKTKGDHSEKPLTTGKIFGFRKFDKVRYFGNDYFIKGRMSTGYAILMDIDGNKIDMLFDCSPCFEPAYLSTEAPSCRSYEKYLESEKEKQSEIQDLCDEILNL